MIIVELVGGLANQMVIYSAAKALSEHLQVELKIDITKLNKDKKRNYALNHLNIEAKTATQKEIDRICQKSNSWFVNKIKKKIRKKCNGNAFGIYVEPTISYDPNFFSLKDNTHIRGNFINANYFSSIEKVLRHEFQIKSPLSNKTKELIESITSGDSVSIHIRRGDYANEKKTNKIHGLIPIDYYKTAIDLINNKIKSPTFYVFSDDISWVKENLSNTQKMHFIDHTDGDTAYEDMYMMSLCKHNIIANSGFSYWGAWLNSNTEKLVISPKQWCADSKLNDRFKLIPEGWFKI